MKCGTLVAALGWLVAALAGAESGDPGFRLPPETRQLLVVVTAAWDASDGEARYYERAKDGARWRLSWAARVELGRTGLAWGSGRHGVGVPRVTDLDVDGPIKREGDGRSPAGVFELRALAGYAPTAPAGARLPYRQATPALRCVDDPGSSHYNRWVDEERVPRDWSSAEDMRRSDEQYRLTVWVGHNDAPARAGEGSCIFLHLRRAPGAPTAGCTSFAAADLERLVARLDPAARPLLVQLPRAWLQRLRRAWALP